MDVSTYQPVIWVERDGQVGFSDLFNISSLKSNFRFARQRG